MVTSRFRVESSVSNPFLKTYKESNYTTFVQLHGSGVI